MLQTDFKSQNIIFGITYLIYMKIQLCIQLYIQTLRSWDEAGLGAVSTEFFFPSFEPQFGLKIAGGGGPQAPSLDLPLQKNFLAIQSPSYYLHLPGNLIF